MQSRFTAIEDAKETLANACSYLRNTHGRTATKGPRLILTAALRCVGTDRDLDLTYPNIRYRVKE